MADDGYIAWRAQPGPQDLLIHCPFDDVLFGGARGGGKTDALLGDWAIHASHSHGFARGILIRRTYQELEEVIARSKEIYEPLGATFGLVSHTWTFPDGAVLKMRSLDRDEDAAKYQGHSYDWIGVDEAGNFPSPGPIDKMRGTMRNAHGVRCVLRLTANPGGVGQQWLKERYIDPAPPLTAFKTGTLWRMFIPSRLRDNRRLLDSDPTYVDRLKASGPAWLVRAWLDGDWSASAGKDFFPQADLLVDARPVDVPRVDGVYAVIDTALKDGTDNDATAVVYFARDSIGSIPLYVVDWDLVRIESDLLITWLPGVMERLEHYAAEFHARRGSLGVQIEDKASGITLLQQCTRRGMRAYALPEVLTRLGKEGRALAISGHVATGKVKLNRNAFEKVCVYAEETKNHLLSQVCGFKLGTKNEHHMDLLDAFTYGVAIGLGNGDGL